MAKDIDPIIGTEIGDQKGAEDQGGTGSVDTGGESEPESGTADAGGKPEEGKETSAEYLQRLYEQKQSEADKATQALKDAKPAMDLYTALAQRPDLIDRLEADIQKPEKKSHTEGKPEYFDPEAAFSDPSSESYKWRVAQDDARLTEKFTQLMGGAIDNINQQNQINETKRRLKEEFGLSDEQVPKVMEFLTTPKDQLPLEDVLKVWMEVNDVTPKKASNSLEAVRKAQEGITSAGAISGAGEIETEDEMADLVKRVKAQASGQNYIV